MQHNINHHLDLDHLTYYPGKDSQFDHDDDDNDDNNDTDDDIRLDDGETSVQHAVRGKALRTTASKRRNGGRRRKAKVFTSRLLAK